MRETKKIYAVLCAFCLFMSGCSVSIEENENPDSQEGVTISAQADVKELDVRLCGSPETLDPALCTTEDGANMILHLYEGLLKMDEDGNPVSAAAEKYKVSKNGLTYTFYLKKGLKWSDGSELKASDFVYSWKRLADSRTEAPLAYSLLGNVKGWDEASNEKAPNPDALKVSASNSYTLVVELKKPCSYFLNLCTQAALVPLNKAAVESGDEWFLNPAVCVSNGAFKLTEYTLGDVIAMDKNEYYTRAEDISFDRISWHLIEDDEEAYQAYAEGELDFLRQPPTQRIKDLYGNKDFHTGAKLGTDFLCFNCEKSPFDDARVRRALTLAIDRSLVSDIIMQGTHPEAKSFIGTGFSDVKKGSSFLESTQKKYGDIFLTDDREEACDTARSLLKEAGYPDGEGMDAVDLLAFKSGSNEDLADYFKSVWEDELGINTEIRYQDWKTYTANRRAGDFDAAFCCASVSWNEPSELIMLFASKNKNNDGRYSNGAFDGLADGLWNTKNPKNHYRKLHRAEKLLLDEAAASPIADGSEMWLMKPQLKGVWYLPGGYFHFSGVSGL